MSIEIQVPQLPESVSDATITRWTKKPGEAVARDEVLLELETDKVVLEVPAPSEGVLAEVKFNEGDTVTNGDILGLIEEGATAAAAEPAAVSEPAATAEAEVLTVNVPSLPESVADATITGWHKKVGDVVRRDENLLDLETDKVVLEVPAPADGVLTEIQQGEGAVVTNGMTLGLMTAGAAEAVAEPVVETTPPAAASNAALSPAVRRMLEENSLNAADIAGSGKDGRLLKSDVQAFVAARTKAAADMPKTNMAQTKPAATPAPAAAAEPALPPQGENRSEQRVPMTRVRQRIAERLVESQQTAAILTTFNEVDLTEVKRLREKYRGQFESEYGVRLGYMSFFVKAVVEGLRRYPVMNAAVDGDEIVYHSYFDIGVAVASDNGLVVPVLRNADEQNFGQIEQTIADYGERAQTGKIKMDELIGGTFSITNGGVFGSMMSTPIINPPQSAILGMHAINERPVVRDGEVVTAPMMYLAVSYDHRIIDGKDSVQFLKTVKEALEDPARLLLQL
jgi:2-oxoglutarate dehydrogenase E2 component (dihydrolipoamide succinyltransferase)